ncbi:hypothetical protein PR202_ga06449 [Eleusine coracana subsp. coracana]|uniref:dolichol kinase n=1 Tax=Eleusine coracana subsp. coracana TaxID=191504 RepID=A0AAV5BXH0_ELECO|nr:hypothetical protein PR202_ga06449 [Eleusine coracana subsp. coracana]
MILRSANPPHAPFEATLPGASSGILLGATTLPSVMLSRIIQMSRILPADPSRPEDFVYLEMQYWAASISCLSVIAFFLWHLRQSPSTGISKYLKYGSLLVVLYLMTSVLFFLLKTGEGEALLVSCGLVLYFGDMLAHTLSKMKLSMSSEALIHTPGNRSDMATIIQPAFLDLAFGAAFSVFLILEMIRIWEIYPLGHFVHQFMNAFTDHRDSEILIVRENDRGYSSRHNFCASSLLDSGVTLSLQWVYSFTAVTLSGLLEAYTAQLDNAFIPLVFYSLLCL